MAVFHDEDDKDAKSLALIGKLINSLNLVVSQFPVKISLKISLTELKNMDIYIYSHVKHSSNCFHVMTIA